jgi:hypothetical protein
LLAPQRGLTAIGHSQNPNTGDGVLQYPGNVKLWESPRQSRGFSPINNDVKAAAGQMNVCRTVITFATSSRYLLLRNLCFVVMLVHYRNYFQ